jgi:hypothetical protein
MFDFLFVLLLSATLFYLFLSWNQEKTKINNSTQTTQKPVEEVKKETKDKKIEIKEKLKINLESNPTSNHIETRMKSTPRTMSNLSSEITRSPRPLSKKRTHKRNYSVQEELDHLEKNVDSVELPKNPEKLEQKILVEFFKRSISDAEQNSLKRYNQVEKEEKVVEQTNIPSAPQKPVFSQSSTPSSFSSATSSSSSAGGINLNSLLEARNKLKKSQ